VEVTHYAAGLTADDESRVASSARQLLARGYEHSLIGLTQALEASDVGVRAEAAFLLGAARDGAAKDALRQHLSDPAARVRVESAMALARLGDHDEAAAVLQAELTGSFFADAPLRAARALALLGDPVGYPRLVEAFASPLPSNRMEAIAVAPAFFPFRGQIVGGEQVDAVALLIDAATDSEAVLRRDALAALVQSGDPRARDYGR
jgi:HEAT repeat protein